MREFEHIAMNKELRQPNIFDSAKPKRAIRT